MSPRLTLVMLWLLRDVFSTETEVAVLRAVRHREARLPCGQGKLFLDGPESYVLWLKNDRNFLYKYPNDESYSGNLFSHCDGVDCAERQETSLVIKHVSDADAGWYRCRVHYQASPSVDYVIELRLVDAPGTPRIYHKGGQEITTGYIGPLSLGASFTLVCEVGQTEEQFLAEKLESETLLYWRCDGNVIDRLQTRQSGITRSELRVRNVTRAHLDAHYECVVQNADVTDPFTASVIVKMYLPPLSVEIRLNNNTNFEAGQPRVVDCVVVGCVPPPSVTWHLGDNLLRPNVHKELHDGNYTVSSLTLAPSLRDDKHKLVCRAHNSHIRDVTFEDKVTVNVGYRPVCVTTEETIGAMEGDAETVSCVVEASPEPLQVSWIFADSRTLYTSVKKVAGHRNRYSSTLTWLPRAGDVGDLLCRATNAFGEQKRPCGYTVNAGGPPHAPECLVIRSYPSTLRIQCKKGWDGGRPQTVHLELRDADGSLRANMSDAAGHFRLPDDAHARNLTARVYATNARGRSKEQALYLHNLTPLTASVSSEAPHAWARWAEGLAAVAAAGVIMAGVFLALRRARRRRQHNPDLVPKGDGTFHREPDFTREDRGLGREDGTLTREDRLLGTTNITVNQMAACPNQYSASPLPACRVLVGCSHSAACPTTQQSYFV